MICVSCKNIKRMSFKSAVFSRNTGSFQTFLIKPFASRVLLIRTQLKQNTKRCLSLLSLQYNYPWSEPLTLTHRFINSPFTNRRLSCSTDLLRGRNTETHVLTCLKYLSSRRRPSADVYLKSVKVNKINIFRKITRNICSKRQHCLHGW